MGSQIFQLGDLVGPEGPAVLVGQVDNLASLQVGWGESMGAIPEVQGVGHLVDPEVGRLEDQVVDSSHSGRQEADQVGVDRSDWHRSLGQSKTLG